MSELHNFPKDRLPSDRQIEGFRHHDETVVERIGRGERSEIKQQVEESAHNELAMQRSEQLFSTTKQAWPPAIKHLLTLMVGAFSALIVGGSVATLIDSTGRGPISKAGGALAAGGCAILADVYSTRYMTKRRMRHEGLQALASIQSQMENYHPTTEFTRHYYTSQKDLLQRVEMMYLAKEPKSEEVMAFSAITVEGILVLLLTFPAGILPALASATFPIMVNLLIAKIHSDYFELPEACKNLLPDYAAYIPEDTVPALDALKIERLNAAVQYVATVRPPKGVRSVGQAKGLAQAKFSRECIAFLKEEGVRAIRLREDQHQQDLDVLPSSCPNPQIDVAGLTADEAEKAKQMWCADWLKEEKYKIEQKRDKDLILIKEDYGQAIAFWENVEAHGLQEYRNHEPSDEDPMQAA